MVKAASGKNREPRKEFSKEEAANVLVHFHEEMLSGVPDEFIAGETGVSLRLVRLYRRAHVVKRRRTGARSLRKEQEQYQVAVSLFGDEVAPGFVTQVESAVLDHRWEPPTFIRRVPLRYDSMCFGMYQLHRFGMHTEELSRAFGILEDDIDDALRLYDSYLQRSGILCPKCRRGLIDPAYQQACVPQCPPKGESQK